MLNYINQNVYLPMMVLLKWGCREFEVYGVFGMFWVYLGVQEVYRVSRGWYGEKEKSVRLLRNQEFIVKKMADYRNHRRLSLKYIKVGIASVSCRLKNTLISYKGYHIIHRAEKQQLYERVRNINKTLYMYQNKRAECYAKLKNLIQDENISKYSLLIDKIKEYRHSKIRAKQTDKFYRLFKKYSGYQHNLGFGTFGGQMFFSEHSPQYQCTGKQRHQQCKHYIHRTHGTNSTH